MISHAVTSNSSSGSDCTRNKDVLRHFFAVMTSTALLLLAAASTLTFKGYVPPHVAADGLRYRVAAEGDVAALMRACRIDDFTQIRAGAGAGVYQLAVTRTTADAVQCLRARLPAGSQLAPLDHWTIDAQTD